jgi:hypothetical protein
MELERERERVHQGGRFHASCKENISMQVRERGNEEPLSRNDSSPGKQAI